MRMPQFLRHFAPYIPIRRDNNTLSTVCIVEQCISVFFRGNHSVNMLECGQGSDQEWTRGAL